MEIKILIILFGFLTMLTTVLDLILVKGATPLQYLASNFGEWAMAFAGFYVGINWKTK